MMTTTILKIHSQAGWFVRLRCVLCVALSVSIVSPLAAASPAEVRAYEVAVRRFQTGAYDLAEKELVDAALVSIRLMLGMDG